MILPRGEKIRDERWEKWENWKIGSCEKHMNFVILIFVDFEPEEVKINFPKRWIKKEMIRYLRRDFKNEREIKKG